MGHLYDEIFKWLMDSRAALRPRFALTGSTDPYTADYSEYRPSPEFFVGSGYFAKELIAQQLLEHSAKYHPGPGLQEAMSGIVDRVVDIVDAKYCASAETAGYFQGGLSNPKYCREALKGLRLTFGRRHMAESMLMGCYFDVANRGTYFSKPLSCPISTLCTCTDYCPDGPAGCSDQCAKCSASGCAPLRPTTPPLLERARAFVLITHSSCTPAPVLLARRPLPLPG